MDRISRLFDVVVFCLPHWPMEHFAVEFSRDNDLAGNLVEVEFSTDNGSRTVEVKH